MKKNFYSKKLVELRKQFGYTQKQVAEKLGVTTHVYQYCEMGHFPNTYEMFMDLCRIFNVSANQLVGIKETFILPQKDNDNTAQQIGQWKD